MDTNFYGLSAKTPDEEAVVMALDIESDFDLTIVTSFKNVSAIHQRRKDSSIDL
ncbi:MAG: hypothetical protein WBP64_06090 [Nitrososphaeraceae archaeon]